MRECIVLWALAAAALAQQPGTTVPAGVPLRVMLDHRIPIKHVGESILGRLVEPVYVFDRVVLPAGSVVEGHIAEIGGVPALRRFTAILNGNFTPPRDVRAQFDALVLSDGSRLSLRTSLSRGTSHTARISTHKADRTSILAFKTPGQMSQLKSALIGMLPYHRQAWSAGTLFNGVLQEPLVAPPGHLEASAGSPAAVSPEAQEVDARLLAPITSAIAQRGAPVEAVVTRPLFSADHRLLIPEGAHVLGDVVAAKPARCFHRNGRMLFVFRQIKLPGDATQPIHGHLDGMEVDFDSHLAIDSEGAARAANPKTRFIFPAIALAVAGLSIHQDYNSQGIPDQDIGGRAESGAVGLGLIGTVLAQASRPLASWIAFTGAGFSIYSTFIARGEDVVLPENTPVRISLQARGVETGTVHRAK
jgi:hypothetical protein